MLLLKDVYKSFIEPGGGELPILDIPEFRVEAGEQVVIVGESGCGKTTLLHVIAGISRPNEGQVRIDGWDITLLSEAECDRFRAEHLGYVFQTFNLLPGFTALENVMLGMSFAKGRTDVDWAKHLLERVGLGHRMKHKPGQMSVGEQQRVSIARAMANHPKIILADEPTANVDSGNQQQIIDLLRETSAEENVALIMVTHSPEVASQFSRVVRLEDINMVLSKK
ncbi:MAG: ABC transporter ATP-binding protein [Planctomycetota bacterium]|nr:MAG: ABC transporter ATP-binding protein [Planctomycetota bacterium]